MRRDSLNRNVTVHVQTVLFQETQRWQIAVAAAVRRMARAVINISAGEIVQPINTFNIRVLGCLSKVVGAVWLLFSPVQAMSATMSVSLTAGMANSASTLTLSHPQYNEAACILLADQIARFKSQSHLTLYKESVRDYERHCQRAQPQPDGPNRVEMRGSAQVSAPTNVVVSQSLADTSLPSVSSASAMTSAQAENVTADAVLSDSAAANRGMASSVSSAADAALQHRVFDSFMPQPGAANGVVAQILRLLDYLWLYVLAIPLWLWVILVTCVVAMPWRGSLTKAEKLGRDAERDLARLLRQSLADECRHYRNLVLHSELGDLTEIDHLVLSPQGVFVIEVKNLQGSITGHEFQPTWTQHVFGNKRIFQNPLRQNYKHTQAVAALLQLDEQQAATMIHSVIAFGRRGTLKIHAIATVMYVDEVALYIQHTQQQCSPDQVFSHEQLQQFSAAFERALEQAPILRQAHKLQEQSKALVRGLH